MSNSRIIFITFVILLISMAVLSCGKEQVKPKDNLLTIDEPTVIINPIILTDEITCFER